MIRKNIYRWHRIIGLVTVIPVIFWTLSGLMHPFMSHWFKPKIAKEFIVQKPVKKEKLKLSIQEVLKQDSVTQLKNFRVVSFNHKTYYQVKRVAGKLAYYDAATGKELENGDVLYAEWMARELSKDSTSTIKSITVQSDFDGQYKFVNRLLPVYKVEFEKDNGLEVFVDTETTRMATFNTNARKAFIWFFDVFHNWSFLDAIVSTNIRLAVMILLLSIIILSTVSGLVIYGILWGKFKKPRSADDKVGILKKYHRQIGIWVSFVTLTFAFSGAYHAAKKFTPDDRNKFSYEPIFKIEELGVNPFALKVDSSKVLNIGLSKIKDKAYYTVFFKKEEEQTPEPAFFDTQTGEELKDGNLLYAKYLANKFSNLSETAIAKEPKEGEQETMADCCEPGADVANAQVNDKNLLKSEWLTKFDREYGFVNKRLPVVKIAYDTPEKTTYYIETATGKLAAKIENADRREGYSFAILHKFLFMDWAGKDVRDIVTMLSALGVLVVSLFGLALFLKVK